MANSDTRFLYTDDDGTLIIVIPADNTSLTLDQIKSKDCPSGKTVYTVNKSEIPTDRSFRNAWTYTE
tara:strand:- start:10 stop:210 length:201 start_codon:yes stop_codon:yes gene_type:complete